MNIYRFFRIVLALAMLLPTIGRAEGLVTPVFAANSILLSPFINGGSSSAPFTFYGPVEKTVQVNASDTVMLCADSDCSLDIYTDDQLKLTITRPGGGVSIFERDYSHGNQGHISPERPTNLTSYFGTGNNTVKIELINLYAPIYNSSAYYLVVSSTPPPNATCPEPLGASHSPPPLRGPETPMANSVLHTALEWEFDITAQCRYPFSVALGSDGRSISLESDRGDVRINEKGEITETSWPTTETTSLGYGFVENDSGVYWSDNLHKTIEASELHLENESKYKHLFLYRPRAWVFVPSISPAIVQNFSLFLFAATVAAFARLALAPASFFVVLDDFVEHNRNQEPSATLQEHISSDSPKSQLTLSEPSEQLRSAIATEYGPLSNWALISTLNSERSRISAYTIFNISGTGFTPNGEVLVSIGLPGDNDTIAQVIRADENGDINVTLEMPPPEAVSLGANLLIAIDYQSLQSSLDSFLNGASEQVTIFMAGQIIEVVEDTTPPVTSGTVSCSRDMFGICRSEATITLSATDDLSGVASTSYSLDGNTWLPYTGPFTLSTNGFHDFLLKSVDKVGNQEQPKESGVIDIQRFVILADSDLNIDRATTITTLGAAHSNCNVTLTDNTTVNMDILNYICQLTDSRNVNLSINHLAQVIMPWQMPFYPLDFYRARCQFVQGNSTITDTSPVYNKCIYVAGDVYLYSTTPTGKLTIVAEGKIYDYTTNATLQAWDVTNGVLFYASEGYFTSATGPNYTGLIIAPSSNIDGPFTNFTIHGGLFASTVNIIEGTTLYAEQAAGFPPSTYQLPLSAPALPTQTPSPIFSPTATPTQTLSPTATATPSKTFTPTRTPTKTRTPTPTRTPTRTATPTRTPTPSRTPTSTRTSTPSLTPTSTLTFTPTVGPNTGFANPSANAVMAGGDSNGFQTSVTNAYVNDSLYAVDTDSGSNLDSTCNSTGKDSHAFYNYNLTIPGGSAIKGIEVRLDAKVDSTAGSPKICVQFSWDGGATWTPAKSTTTLSSSEATYILGNPTDTWGRTWSTTDLSNANLRVRVINVASSTLRDFALDWIAVRVHY